MGGKSESSQEEEPELDKRIRNVHNAAGGLLLENNRNNNQGIARKEISEATTALTGKLKRIETTLSKFTQNKHN